VLLNILLFCTQNVQHSHHVFYGQLCADPDAYAIIVAKMDLMRCKNTFVTFYTVKCDAKIYFCKASNPFLQRNLNYDI